jgi:hypothetical protein
MIVPSSGLREAGQFKSKGPKPTASIEVAGLGIGLAWFKPLK